MRWPATASARSPLAAMSTTPSRSNSPACAARSRPCWAGLRWPGENPMAERPDESPGIATARKMFFVLGSVGLLVGALYWGQRIFVPLALAVLLTFLLSPLVSWLERRGLPRIPAVLSVATLAFLLIG